MKRVLQMIRGRHETPPMQNDERTERTASAKAVTGWYPTSAFVGAHLKTSRRRDGGIRNRATGCFAPNDCAKPAGTMDVMSLDDISYLVIGHYEGGLTNNAVTISFHIRTDLRGKSDSSSSLNRS